MTYHYHWIRNHLMGRVTEVWMFSSDRERNRTYYWNDACVCRWYDYCFPPQSGNCCWYRWNRLVTFHRRIVHLIARRLRSLQSNCFPILRNGADYILTVELAYHCHPSNPIAHRCCTPPRTYHHCRSWPVHSRRTLYLWPGIICEGLQRRNTFCDARKWDSWVCDDTRRSCWKHECELVLQKQNRFL